MSVTWGEGGYNRRACNALHALLKGHPFGARSAPEKMMFFFVFKLCHFCATHYFTFVLIFKVIYEKRENKTAREARRKFLGGVTVKYKEKRRAKRAEFFEGVLL